MESAPLPTWRRAGESLLALALARAEFASVELTIAAQAGLRWLLVALASCVIAMLGLIALSATLVIALWEHFGWYSLAAMAFLYCAATALLVFWLLRSLAMARPLLADTLAEIAKDGAAIHSSVMAHPADDDNGS